MEDLLAQYRAQIEALQNALAKEIAINVKAKELLTDLLVEIEKLKNDE